MTGMKEGGGLHRPVMTAEVIEFLRPSRGQVIFDGTFGTGGHAQDILGHIAPGGRLIAVDRDPHAFQKAKERSLEVVEAASCHCKNYRDIRSILADEGIDEVNGILLDLGVSSLQLDDGGRGFSFRQDGPLDMRMGPDAPAPASELLNTLSEEEISRIIYQYGEERWARRIASFIVRARERQPVETTGQLVEIIRNAVPAGARRGRAHPARRTFQALRIAVNSELEDLKEGLQETATCLAMSGRMVVLTYHSLEDRIVKSTFGSLAKGSDLPPGTSPSRPSFRLLNRKVVRPSPEETGANPRSRSAKLRAIERVSGGI